MCLAIPGKIESITDGVGQVDFNGLKREVPLDLVSHAKVGDYILVHAGFAIEVMTQQEAQKTLDILSDISDVTEVNENL